MSESLERAAACYRDGRYAEAEEAACAALSAAPGSPEALLLMARIALARRENQAALGYSERAAKALPDRPDAHLVRGIAAMAAGRLEAARAALERVLELEPHNAKAHLKLGTLSVRLGDSDAALGHYRAAIAARPRYAKAESSLGNLLRQLDRLGEALPHLERAWRLNPDEPGIVNNYALGLAAVGETDKALGHFRALAAAHPEHCVVLVNLGSLLMQLDRPAEALEPLARAVALAPDLPEARAAYANALIEVRRLADARAELETLVRRWPKLAGAWLNLGHLERIEGRLEEAQRCMERAADLDAENIGALMEIAAQQRERTPPARRQAIERLLARPTLPARQRNRLHFAMAAIHDGAGEWDLAFRHLAAGNALRRAEDGQAGRAFDPAVHRAFINRLIAAFTPALFARLAGAGDPSEVPVYVFGVARSGTTLVEQILASHPEVHGAGELRDLEVLSRGLRGPEGAAYPEALLALSAADLGRLGRETAARLSALAPAARRVVDKLPPAFLYPGLLALILPRARLIHCRRDPVATGFSCFEQNFQVGHEWSRDLADIAAYYRAYERLMEHWRAVLPVPMHEIRYETLVSDPEPAIRGMLTFCGLSWDARCLDFHRTERPVRTASQRQVRRPLYTASIDRWRRYEAHLGPLIAALAESGRR